ncbi:MAG: aspartate aminotransferase family protein [Bacteroidales bacterium]|nr:aspartate aminotransferase family protein [Bacteroidales bacterium]
MLSNHNLFLAHVGQTSNEPMLIEIESARGIWLFGPSGEKYLDLVSGVSVSNAGHGNPSVIEAVKNQLDKYMHLMVYGELVQSPQVYYAKKLSDVLGHHFETVYFVNSGSEAVEGAIKTARRYTSRSRVVSFKKAYHGSTLGALSLYGEDSFKSGFMPLIPEMVQAEFNNIDSLSVIDDKVAAVIVEPVQAEAGIICPREDFLHELKERCGQTGSLLIFDEIQTGFGRTGSLFAFQKFGLVPDIICLAKSLGGGMPLGAFVSSKKIISTLAHNPAMGHITTFGGHPVSCAAGKAALDFITDNKLDIAANQKGERFRSKLKHKNILEIRGEALFLAVKLSSPEMAAKFMSRGLKNGLMLDSFLFCNDSFRIAPPLIIENDEIDYAVDTILKTIDEIS